MPSACYKATGKLQCNVVTLIFRQGLLSVRDTVEALSECFLTISQQWCGSFDTRFEHSWMCRDRAHAVCIATRLVAGCDAMWRPSSSGLVSCLFVTQWSSSC